MRTIKNVAVEMKAKHSGTDKAQFDWDERIKECRKPENIGMAAATGKVKGFCFWCGKYNMLSLSATAFKCGCFPDGDAIPNIRHFNPFMEGQIGR